jgi:hypothetical protein
VHKTVEAVVEADGRVRLLEVLPLPPGSRALVTILEGEYFDDTALLSERALATDWDREEEDDAWQYLQQAK